MFHAGVVAPSSVLLLQLLTPPVGDFVPPFFVGLTLPPIGPVDGLNVDVLPSLALLVPLFLSCVALEPAEYPPLLVPVV